MFWRMLTAIWFAGHPGEKCILFAVPKENALKEMFSEIMGFNHIWECKGTYKTWKGLCMVEGPLCSCS